MKLSRREALHWAGVSGVAGLLPGVRAFPSGPEGGPEWEPGRGLDSGPGWSRAGADESTLEVDRQAAAARDTCELTPAQTEGPYFARERPERSDLRFRSSDSVSSGSARDASRSSGERIPGVELALELRVLTAGIGSCTPLAGAGVDLWHCDALGVYSRVPALGTAREGFLRGFQRVGQDGRVRFRTIYPGWYPGRAVHLHFKVAYLEPDRPGGRKSDGRLREFASQLYFDDAINRRVHREEPYRQRGEPPLNRQDGIYRYGGDRLLLQPERDGSGYVAQFDIGLRGFGTVG